MGRLTIRLTLIWCLAQLLNTSSLSDGERIRYDNYRLYKVKPTLEKDLEFLNELANNSDSLLFLDGIESQQQDINVIVAPYNLTDFQEFMQDHDITVELLNANLQPAHEAAYNAVAKRSTPTTYDWTKFQQLDATYNWLRSLSTKYPTLATLLNIGKTYEGRSILGLKIAHNNIGQAQKPGIFIESGIHAREWISSTTATFIIQQLLTSSDAAIQQLAQHYEWHIFPHINPDGYVYTHTTDRYWRSNRQRYGKCFGVNLNRNFDIGFTAHTNPCNKESYKGPAAFSENETRALASYIMELGKKLKLYISFHNYSQLLMFPYGYRSRDSIPRNQKDYEQITAAAIAALRKRYGTLYKGGNLNRVLYSVGGNSIDWIYEKAHIDLAFAYELRPNYTKFDLPPEQIIPTGKETLDSIVALIAEAKQLGYFKV